MLHIRVFALGLLFCQSASACLDFAQTPLEELFCIVQSKDAAALPYSLKDFRKNTVPTQRLLLKRPAERQGLTLPTEPAPGPTAAATSRPSSPTTAGKAAATAHVAKPSSPPAAASSSFPSACRLEHEAIACGELRYQLLHNTNAALGAEQLRRVVNGFAKYRGALADEVAVRQYLTDLYGDYIERMVELGLAGVTLSFTKFYHTFRAATARGGDFAERLVTMFNFLGKDKASMGVARSYTDKRPQSLDACAELSPSLIVCDDVATNWIYQRQ